MDQEQTFALLGLIEFLGLTLIFWLLKDTKWFGWFWTCWWILWGVFIASLFLNKGKISIKELWNNFTGQVIDEYPLFNKIYTRVLENDDLRKGL